jgi:hypothetical protein
MMSFVVVYPRLWPSYRIGDVCSCTGSRLLIADLGQVCIAPEAQVVGEEFRHE